MTAPRPAPAVPRLSLCALARVVEGRDWDVIESAMRFVKWHARADDHDLEGRPIAALQAAMFCGESLEDLERAGVPMAGVLA